ncbi:phosphoethanolamine transferase [Massilia endophytica]|uniref:phosphoethanolamine transferase n=1 Tax=Massilia endophytica TaxID=2899220 RepID=UPI001E452E87|nr:phosphoethanolamine transferase [Massilia endophytica]UGQ46702.1 phosphoethanolamine transferase [Massilia endophytica]
MRFLLRPAHLFLLLSYLALSAVPFIPLAMGKPVPEAWQVLGIEIVAWAAVWALFKRPARFHWFLIPAFMALPTEIYLIVFYGQGISTHHLGILAETSPREAMEFLGRKVWSMLAIMIAVAAWWVLTFRAARQTRELDWHDSSRWVAMGLLALFAALGAYGWEFGVKPEAPVSAAASASADKPASVPAASATGWTLPPLPHWAKVPVEFDAFIRSWPFGLMARGIDFYKERRYLAELDERSSRFRFGAQQASADTAPEVVVLVLGESSRYDRWSLNGYKRETNPLLSQEENLVPLSDVVTSVAATRLSVPVIISRKPAMQSLKDGFTEKSFVSAYKEAGFKTWWLSNQISFGKFDTPVSVFAKEADVIQFLNLGTFNNNSNFDEILFEPLRHALADPSPKKLIVLHTLGSHWNYSQRHPQSFDKWKPSLFGIDKPVYTDLDIKPQLNNSYDNSILYTDWFLSQVIATLKGGEQSAAMLYVADHGQTLYDGSCRLAFHGHNTQFEFHVPAFVWYSGQYLERYPDKVEQLARHRKTPLATENMFHTLLDMADIRYPDDRLEWSFLSAQFKRHKRYVDSYGWSNYDNSTFRGDCREVIDKDKPLPR